MAGYSSFCYTVVECLERAQESGWFPQTLLISRGPVHARYRDVVQAEIGAQESTMMD
jgi:hypothetical protein